MKKSTMKTAIMNWMYGAAASILFSIHHQKSSKNGTTDLIRSFDDEWKEPEPTLENTSVYFTEDGVNYLIVAKTIIPISEHFADNGKTVGDVIEDVIRFAVKTQKK